eukprot:4563908-Pleurochrysis_carterae.AAC.1
MCIRDRSPLRPWITRHKKNSSPRLRSERRTNVNMPDFIRNPAMTTTRPTPTTLRPPAAPVVPKPR